MVGTIKKQICLPVDGITVTLFEDEDGDLSGTVVSNLHDVESAGPLPAALDAIEAMVLAHACARVDIETPAYLEGLETALETVFNRWG